MTTKQGKHKGRELKFWFLHRTSQICHIRKTFPLYTWQKCIQQEEVAAILVAACIFAKNRIVGCEENRRRKKNILVWLLVASGKGSWRRSDQTVGIILFRNEFKQEFCILATLFNRDTKMYWKEKMKKKIKKSPPQKNPRKNLEKEKNDRKYIKRVEEEKMPH